MDTQHLKKDAGILKKLMASIKKALAKEFLWILIILAISIPIALILQYIISLDAKLLQTELSKNIKAVATELYPKQPTFRLLYTLSVTGIYFSRLVTAAIKTQLNSKS